MNRYSVLITSLTLFSLSLLAQTPHERSNYKLFWKISGHGLTSPSYLFGTMHVKDNRVFDFSDSVLLKISECEAFALEVHPDSAVRVLLTRLFENSNLQRNQFKDIFDEANYRKIDSLMRKKTGYSLDKLKSPSLAKLFLEKKLSKKNKSTFLDAYLYNIAKKQGKIILGLEDAGKQMATLDIFSPQSIKADLIYNLQDTVTDYIVEDRYAQWIELYYRGDIDVIRKYMKANPFTSQDHYDKLITQRNLGMAESIEEEMRKHSTFIAVGAAHLPGEEGLIYLLQNRGYIVTPMKPLFTGLASRYKFEPEEQAWQHYDSETGGYSFDMPSKPFPLKIDSLGIVFQTSMDIGIPMLYQSTFFSLNNQFQGYSSQEVLNRIEETIRRNANGKIDKSKNITIKGLNGKEFTFSTLGYFYRAELIHRGDVIYMLIIGATRDAVFSAEADRFFNSFQPKDFRGEQWQDLTDKQGAFAIQLKGEPVRKSLRRASEEAGGVYVLNLLYSSNLPEQESYLVRYNDFPPGYVSYDDSIYYAEMASNIAADMKGKNVSQKEIMVNGFRGHEFTFDVSLQGLVTGRMILRGNRLYILMATSPKGSQSESISKFINSLRFLPYEPTELKEVEFRKEGFRIKLPESFSMDSTNKASTDLLLDDKTIYNCRDDNSGIQYSIVINALSEYDQYPDEEAYFDARNKIYLQRYDSIVSKENITGDNFLGQDVVFTSQHVNAKRKIRRILSGKTEYELIGYLPADYNYSKTTDDFFNSFIIDKKAGDWNLFSDKTERILTDIASADTLVQKEAKAAIWSHEFKKKDLPNIYAALKNVYPDDMERYGSTRGALFGALRKTNDSTTLGFISEIYPGLPDSSALKDDALAVLSDLHTTEATTAMIDLLLSTVDKNDFNSYKVLGPYSDTLHLLNTILPEMIRLESKFDYPYFLFSLAESALDSAVLSDEVKAQVTGALIAMGKQKTANPVVLNKEGEEYYQKRMYWEYFAEVLTKIPFNDDVKNILAVIQQCGEPNVMRVTVTALIKNNIRVTKADLETIANDPLYRNDLYVKLKELKKENLFPSRQRTQEKFAESALYGYLEYDDDVPEKIELLGRQRVKYKGTSQLVYVYKYQFTEDDSWYLGFSGPFQLKSKEPVIDGDLTFSSYEEYDSRKKLKEIITPLLEEREAVLE